MAQTARGMHPERIKAGLRERFGSLKAFAATLGVHRTAISAVLRKPLYSIRVERRIAKALELSPAVIWPDRWSADGTPLPRTLLGASRAATPPQSSQKRRAA